jgi:hypothetical protein
MPSTKKDAPLEAVKAQRFSFGVKIAMTIYSTAKHAPSTDINLCLFIEYALVQNSYFMLQLLTNL